MPLYLASSHYAVEPEDELALYRQVLNWAGARAASFKILLETRVYRRPADLQRLRDFADFHQAESGYEPGVLEGEGAVTSALFEALGSIPVPEGAIAGDLCPVLRLELSADERTIYTVEDYGRTQLLDLSAEAFEDLKRALSEHPEWPARIEPWRGAGG